jgi:hypothetical protein
LGLGAKQRDEAVLGVGHAAVEGEREGLELHAVHVGQLLEEKIVGRGVGEIEALDCDAIALWVNDFGVGLIFNLILVLKFDGLI